MTVVPTSSANTAAAHSKGGQNTGQRKSIRETPLHGVADVQDLFTTLVLDTFDKKSRNDYPSPTTVVVDDCSASSLIVDDIDKHRNQKALLLDHLVESIPILLVKNRMETIKESR
jgi:hypothetical protein